MNFVKFLRAPVYIEHVWSLLLRTDTDIMKISENGITFSDPIKVANKFNNHVTNIAQNLLEVLGKTKNQLQSYLKNPSEHSLSLKETESEDVLKIPKSLN